MKKMNGALALLLGMTFAASSATAQTGTVESVITYLGSSQYCVQKAYGDRYFYKAKNVGKTPSGSPLFLTTSYQGPYYDRSCSCDQACYQAKTGSKKSQKSASTKKTGVSTKVASKKTGTSKVSDPSKTQDQDADSSTLSSSNSEIQAITPPTHKQGDDCTTTSGQKGTYGPGGSCIGAINPPQMASLNQSSSDSTSTSTNTTAGNNSTTTTNGQTQGGERYQGVNSDYVGTYRSSLDQDRQDAKANLQEKTDALNNATTRSEQKQAKKDVKDAEKAMAKADGEVDILREYRGSYGGKYGGAKVETTQTINMGVRTVSTIASQVATNNATSQNNSVMYGIQQQGSAATQKAINNSQADMLENSAKANQKLGMATVVMSAVQAERIYAHVNSRKKVGDTYSNGMQKAETAMIAAQNDYDTKVSGCKAMTNPAFQSQCLTEENAKLTKAKDLYQSQKENAINNKMGELDAQGTTAAKQTIETATTTAQAAMMLGQANSLKKAANAIRNQVTADTTNPFTFNPGAVTPNPTPDSSAITDPGTVVADDSVPGGDLAGNDQLNPNIPDPGAGGPAAGQFQAGNPAAGAGGGGMGMGSVGGTSAAKDDGAKPETAALAKSESGKYSAGEGTGSRFARGGNGGSGVGVDSGFADLLKKFLPGAEEEKKNHDLAFDNDRSPASDQAAVLGRNQNIFEAIHKRYQKKHNEGAIVFVGDQG